MAKANSQFTLLDYSNEKANTTIYNGAITAVSLPGFLTELGNMRSSIDAITRGTLQKESWTGDVTVLSQIPPTDEDAHRETKWLVRYRGNTSQKIFTLTIPTADPNGKLLPQSDKANLTIEPFLTFVTRFNAFARTPDSDLENVTILDVTYVGRNL